MKIRKIKDLRKVKNLKNIEKLEINRNSCTNVIKQWDSSINGYMNINKRIQATEKFPEDLLNGFPSERYRITQM